MTRVLYVFLGSNHASPNTESHGTDSDDQTCYLGALVVRDYISVQ